MEIDKKPFTPDGHRKLVACIAGGPWNFFPDREEVDKKLGAELLKLTPPFTVHSRIIEEIKDTPVDGATLLRITLYVGVGIWDLNEEEDGE